MNSKKIVDYLNIAFDFFFLGLLILLPLFFWNLTSEFYEMPKFILFSAAILILLIFWVVKFLFSGKVTITRSFLDLPFLLLLIILLISTFFAASKPVAIFGSLPRIHGSLISFVAYILFYFILVSNLKKMETIKGILYALMGVGVVLSLISLLHYFGLKIFPLPFTQIANFTPTGSIFSTASLLILLIPFILLSIFTDSKNDPLSSLAPSLTGTAVSEKLSTLIKNICYCLILSLFVATIILIGSWPIWVAILIAFILTAPIIPQTALVKKAVFAIIPLIIGGVLLIISNFSFVQQNFFYNNAQNFPRELQLPFATSWIISVSAFRDFPIWGTGPASYLFDFTTYKPIQFNSTPLWTVRFDSAFNEYLQFLATLGIGGLLCLLLITVAFISRATQTLMKNPDTLSMSLALAGILFFILLALHPSTILLWILGIFMMAAFVAATGKDSEELQIGAGNHPAVSVGGVKYLHFDALPVLLMLIVIAIVGTGFYFLGRFTLADMHHRTALNAISAGQGLEGYNQLIQAENNNPYADLYRLDLAQTSFALANAIASAKGPTEASPSGSLTDQDKQNIQVLLSQAITEGRNATTLSPNNPTNWTVLGSIYRQISGVAQNALGFALDAYGRAIQRDPLNPLLRLDVGGIYYSIQNLDMAVRFFTDTVNLKPDYANAYYNLAVVLKDKGDLAGAMASAQQTVSLLDPQSQDYEAASKFLADLKTQSEDQEAKLKEIQESSALEDKNLPEVLNLPEMENISTPAAIKK